jgi:hypothetical protein
VPKPAIVLMKSRRRIASRSFRSTLTFAHREHGYSRDLRPAKRGSGVGLHGSIPEPLMSALAH